MECRENSESPCRLLDNLVCVAIHFLQGFRSGGREHPAVSSVFISGCGHGPTAYREATESATHVRIDRILGRHYSTKKGGSVFMSPSESHQFQAETQKLLNIIINSIYTNKEIFLRELISNASDALDKTRFESSRGTDIADPDQSLEIRISMDTDNKLLKISDTGIGMSKDELVANLGTIAKSGTEEFIKQVAEEKENPDSIIGRFGVGFYSVFMVADQVRIKSRSARKDESPVSWVSDGMGGYEVEELDEDLKRGTEIEIQLKEDCQEYLELERIKSIIKKHSNFISFPIYVEQEKVNTVPALWKESKFSISKDQYTEFYKLSAKKPIFLFAINVGFKYQNLKTDIMNILINF